jgi:putative membrane protein
MLTKADHDRISNAVKAVEAKTSGEILCVLSHKVSNYRETPLAWAIAAALVAPPLGTAFGLHPWLMSQAGGDWVATNAVSLDTSVRLALTGYAILQLVIFLVVVLAIAFATPLKLALTPKSLKHRRVRQAAMFQLRAARLLGSGSGVVVIFASEAERMVTVVADEAIHLKAGDAAWNEAVAAVLEGIKSGDAASGFVAAVEICGGYLADHFPANGATHNALSDRMVEF